MTWLTSGSQLWNWRGKSGRGAYLGWGVALMAVKYHLDRLLAALVFGRDWDWTHYWQPFPESATQLSPDDRAFAVTLLVLALPFIAAGIVLTVRRLRDLAWPLWLVAGFFLPALNLILFVLLVTHPGRDAQAQADPASQPPLLRWLAIRSAAGSACLAVVVSSALTVGLAMIAVWLFKDYGWGVFVALPFILGMTAALLHGASAPRSWGACAGIALLALLFAAGALVAVAFEGIICIIMAAPIAAPLALLGATAGYYLQARRPHGPAPQAPAYVATWLALPLAFTSDKIHSGPPPLIAATTSIEIEAPPTAVWTQVVTFSELPPPRELVFRSGIAYPIRATIRGRGVGAVRYCEFSTGPFVEPITVWDEPRRLAFDVVAQPHPMRELSPYRDLDTPHLHGFFRSQHGQFLLTALPGNRTRLDGTTWYAQELWPARYWQIWSDYLVHRIHTRVLAHIKTLAEASPPK